MNIRPAEPSDRPAVVKLDAACFPKDAWSERSWADEFTRPDRQVLVADAPTAAEGAGRLAGFVVLLVPPGADDPVDLLRIAVDPADRRTGVGRRLLATALERHPGRTVLLEVAASNEAAIGLYAGSGFTDISRRRGYYAGGEDAVIMRRAGETE
ncbi:ribosomal-protein-alanine acetyltransferase [Kribbella sp. ALI-6-A]|uniref:GNAT family N-acetyltransferase n=1 Tax=Kribbella sp. ALI-6-A TaxID=1933817 RepID=UPI00097C9AA4|nr:N-acetyltransferase [Kribbella sp. ALI-6-A]ONI68804.1 ribosomal-protein-alanine acetyltransferase [Kribbella sp. ALI-6-A]